MSIPIFKTYGYLSYSNTGDLSILLYLLFVAIAIGGMIYIYYLIFKNKLENEKIDKIIDIFKSVIVTTAIGTVTLIVSDLFKERKQDLDEMTAFKDYLPYVTDSTSSLDDKISFCEYMVAVAPDGPLQRAWQHWESKLKQKDSSINVINAQITKEQTVMDKQPEKTSAGQIEHIQQLEAQKQNLLQDVNAKSTNTYLVVLGADKSISGTTPDLTFARQISAAATLYKKGNWYRIVIPVLSNYDDARAITDSIREKSNGQKQSYIVSLKSWCKSTVFSQTENCIICNQ